MRSAGLDANGIVAKAFEALGKDVEGATTRAACVSQTDTPRHCRSCSRLKVMLAQPRGFCAGVVRAIEIVERALEKYGPPVYVRHEIVHNKYVVESLKAKGARFVENVDEMPDERGHDLQCAWRGRRASSDEASNAQSAGARTRPARWSPRFTIRASATSARAARVILIGHAGHPEVEGTMGQIPAPVVLVQTRRRRRQSSTFRSTRRSPMSPRPRSSVDDTRDIIAALTKPLHRYPGPGHARHLLRDAKPPDARCVTSASSSIVMLVVGATNTSNSNRLREIGDGGRHPELPDRRRQRARSGLAGRRETVGITAGASAPEVLVERCDRRAKTDCGPVEVSTLPGREENIDVPSARRT